MISGIYKITNQTNGKCYVGSSKNILKRWCGHRNNLKKGQHVNEYLQHSWDKYGESCFAFEVLKELNEPTQEELFVEEKEFIDRLKPEYNLGTVGGGDNISNHPRLAEIKKKHSVSSKKAWESTERRQEWSRRTSGENSFSWKGGPPKCVDCGKTIWYTSTRCSHCARTGVNNPIFGTHRSEETKKKISDHHKALSKEEHSFYGKHHTQETKEKLSKSKLGKNGKRVRQIDPITNEVVRVWESTSEAYRHLTGKNGSTNCIRHVCEKLKNKNGYEYKTAYGYKWEWDNA
jgi:group I intron endonuclease